MNKCKRQIENLERDMATYEEEMESINRYYLEHPLDYSPEKQVRLDELKALLGEAEERWMVIQEKLERLEREDV